jgi:hypothetical protein
MSLIPSLKNLQNQVSNKIVVVNHKCKKGVTLYFIIEKSNNIL